MTSTGRLCPCPSLPVYRVQADGLEIEAAAKRRLADEYDAAQAAGEVAKGRPKSIPEQNTFSATAKNIGLSSKEVHDARQFRDAEVLRLKLQPQIRSRLRCFKNGSLVRVCALSNCDQLQHLPR